MSLLLTLKKVKSYAVTSNLCHTPPTTVLLNENHPTNFDNVLYVRNTSLLYPEVFVMQKNPLD